MMKLIQVRKLGAQAIQLNNAGRVREAANALKEVNISTTSVMIALYTSTSINSQNIAQFNSLFVIVNQHLESLIT